MSITTYIYIYEAKLLCIHLAQYFKRKLLLGNESWDMWGWNELDGTTPNIKFEVNLMILTH